MVPIAERGVPGALSTAKVTIYEVAHRPWGELMTDARVDDFPYVGTREWRRRQHLGKPLGITNPRGMGIT
jgi:hypothetical protein